MNCTASAIMATKYICLAGLKCFFTFKLKLEQPDKVVFFNNNFFLQMGLSYNSTQYCLFTRVL